MENFRRSRTSKVIAGVAGGIGKSLDFDPVLIRLAFAVTLFFGGAGLIAYLLCWIIVPKEDKIED